MHFPVELWDSEKDLELARSLVETFKDKPVILTDRLVNTIYLTPAAEDLFHDRGEALVNRLLFSLIGYGDNNCLPKGLEAALLGKGLSWRGVVHCGEDKDNPHTRVAEASAIINDGQFVCGVLRVSEERVDKK